MERVPDSPTPTGKEGARPNYNTTMRRAVALFLEY